MPLEYEMWDGTFSANPHPVCVKVTGKLGRTRPVHHQFFKETGNLVPIPTQVYTPRHLPKQKQASGFKPDVIFDRPISYLVPISLRYIVYRGSCMMYSHPCQRLQSERVDLNHRPPAHEAGALNQTGPRSHIFY